MKVLYVCTDFNRSGAALAMIELANKIKQMGNDVYVVFPGFGEAVSEAKQRGLNCYVIRSYEWVKPIRKKETIHIKFKWALKHLYNILSIIRLSSFIIKRNIDVVHINTLWGYVGAVAAKITQKPYVWHMREMLAQQGLQIRWEKYGTRLVNSASALIAISEVVKNNYEQIFNSELIRMIYDGVDIDFGIERNRELLNSDEIHIMVAGGVRPHKRQFDVIKAAHILDLMKIGFHISIVGADNTDYAAMIKDYIGQNHLSQHITFIGEVDKIFDYWNRNDIAITAAEHEAFGRVTVEGMLAGCVTIASDSGASKEIIKDRETGYLYRVGDYEALANTIAEIYREKIKARTIAYNGQKSARERFDSSINAQKMNALYYHIIKNLPEG